MMYDVVSIKNWKFCDIQQFHLYWLPSSYRSLLFNIQANSYVHNEMAN